MKIVEDRLQTVNYVWGKKWNNMKVKNKESKIESGKDSNLAQS